MFASVSAANRGLATRPPAKDEGRGNAPPRQAEIVGFAATSRAKWSFGCFQPASCSLITICEPLDTSRGPPCARHAHTGPNPCLIAAATRRSHDRSLVGTGHKSSLVAAHRSPFNSAARMGGDCPEACPNAPTRPAARNASGALPHWGPSSAPPSPRRARQRKGRRPRTLPKGLYSAPRLPARGPSLTTLAQPRGTGSLHAPTLLAEPTNRGGRGRARCHRAPRVQSPAASGQ